MIREQIKQTLKLRLLTFVLVLAITCYSLNPAPRPVTRKRQEDDLLNEKKLDVEPQSMPTTLPVAFRQSRDGAEALPSFGEDEDDFKWPEFIDG